jgi:hypothetical protein
MMSVPPVVWSSCLLVETAEMGLMAGEMGLMAGAVLNKDLRPHKTTVLAAND